MAGKINMTVNSFCKAFGETAAGAVTISVIDYNYWGKLALLLGSLKEWLLLALGLL